MALIQMESHFESRCGKWTIKKKYRIQNHFDNLIIFYCLALAKRFLLIETFEIHPFRHCRFDIRQKAINCTNLLAAHKVAFSHPAQRLIKNQVSMGGESIYMRRFFILSLSDNKRQRWRCPFYDERRQCTPCSQLLFLSESASRAALVNGRKPLGSRRSFCQTQVPPDSRVAHHLLPLERRSIKRGIFQCVRIIVRILHFARSLG